MINSTEKEKSDPSNIGELIRHLRFIHFTLVTVCIGILMTVSTTNTKIDEAIQETDELINSLYDRTIDSLLFDHGWLASALTKYIDSEKVEVYSADSLTFDISGKKYRVFDVVHGRFGFGDVVDFHRPGKEEREYVDYDLVREFFTNPTLGAFKDFWNQLYLDCRLILPSSLSDNQELYVSYLLCTLKDALFDQTSGWVRIPKLFLSGIESDVAQVLESHAFSGKTEYKFWNNIESEVFWNGREWYRGGDLEHEYYIDVLVDLDTELFIEDFVDSIRNVIPYFESPLYVRVLFPVSTYEWTRFTLQESLNYVLENKLRLNLFENRYRSLNEMSEELSDFKLLKVPEVLHLLKKHGGTNFEAFGLKIPLIRLIEFGIVAIIFLQLYLYLHMSQLGVHKTHWKKRVNDWIGLYDIGLAKLLTLMSGVILPIIAQVVLLWNNIQSDTELWIGMLNFSITISSAIIGYLTTQRFRGIWR